MRPTAEYLRAVIGGHVDSFGKPVRDALLALVDENERLREVLGGSVAGFLTFLRDDWEWDVENGGYDEAARKRTVARLGRICEEIAEIA